VISWSCPPQEINRSVNRHIDRQHLQFASIVRADSLEPSEQSFEFSLGIPQRRFLYWIAYVRASVRQVCAIGFVDLYLVRSFYLYSRNYETPRFVLFIGDAPVVVKNSAYFFL
jgi:hypothetical protein